AGDYTFQVTDANGCFYQELYTVKAVTPIAIAGSVTNGISCNAANGINTNGSASFTVTGVSPASTYKYDINGGSVTTGQTASVITLPSLGAGVYVVTVTDETTLCTSFASVTLAEPALIAFTAAASKVYCSEDISQITISGVSGGSGVYSYAAVKAGDPAPAVYSTAPAVSVDTDLTVLSWDVYVKDAAGCIVMQTVGVPSDAAPAVKALPIPAQCFTGSPLTVDLSLYFDAPAGGAVYTVNGSDISGTSAVLNASGSYTFGVRDANGCTVTTPYTVNPQLGIDAVLVSDLTCLAPASISFTLKAGSGSYTAYEVSYNGNAYAAAVSPDSYNFAGTYKFRVTDSQGCKAESNDVIVTPKTVPSFTVSQVNVSCSTGTDGSITVIPADGIAPYTFALSGAVSNHTGDASGIYTGLPAGSYTMIVTDAKGCASAAAAA
ncbi:SprB repeat-containing protein, partial [Flavobacterium sp. HJJ]|uniref:SprB repeat-containing protein n=1 Tax=Flavobacterium sp. HJJ TaxID=2783792 RepID=UPI00188A1C92